MTGMRNHPLASRPSPVPFAASHARRALAVASLLLASSGCSSRSAAPSQGAPAQELTAAQKAKLANIAPSFDVGKVIRQVHFAYRPDGAGFSAGHATYGVRTDGAGRWSIEPRHYPTAKQSPSTTKQEPLVGTPARFSTVA